MDVETTIRLLSYFLFGILSLLYVFRMKRLPDGGPIRFELSAVILAVVFGFFLVFMTARNGDGAMAVGMAIVLVPIYLWALSRAWSRRKS